MDQKHASATTELGDKKSGSAPEPPAPSSSWSDAEDLDENFDDPIIIHLTRNTAHCTCEDERGGAVSESDMDDMDSPSVFEHSDDLEATPAQKEFTAHILCSTPVPAYDSSSVLQSPQSSVDSNEFYTPEISQEIFSTQSSNIATNTEKENPLGVHQIKGFSPFVTKRGGKANLPVETAPEAQPIRDTPLALSTKQQNSAGISTRSSIDDLEVYWRQAHQRLTSTILDIPSDAFDPFTPRTVPGETVNQSDVKTQFILSIPLKDDFGSPESVDSPLTEKSTAASSEPFNLASLWIPPSTSQTLPHTPDRPNWALAPEEIPPTPPKGTGSQRRTKSRSSKSERHNNDAKRWLTPSPLNNPRTPNPQSVHRHVETPGSETKPCFDGREVIATFSPRNQPTTLKTSPSPSHNVADNSLHHLPLPMAPEDILDQSHQLPVLTTSIPQDMHASNIDILQYRHAELIRQNQVLVALLRSHYQHSIDDLPPSHQSPQYIRESPPLETSPTDVHHALGPDIDEKGFQRSRTTISPSLNSDHKLNRRTSWRKSVSLPTISETAVGSVQSTPAHHSHIKVEHISVPYPTLYKKLPSQDPIPNSHDSGQKDGKSDKGVFQPRYNQIKWPSRSEEMSFHESAHPTLSWHGHDFEGRAGHTNFRPRPVSSPVDGNRISKASELDHLRDLSPADSPQYTLPLADGGVPNWRMSRPIEDTRIERMARDRTVSDSHPKGRNDPSRSSGFMSNIPIAVRLQRKTSFTNQHETEARHDGGHISPSDYMGTSGYESNVAQIQSNWPPKLASTKITSGWRQNLGSSPYQEIRATSGVEVDRIAKPVARTRSLKMAARVGSTTSPSTVARSRFAAPPQASLPSLHATSVDLAPVHVLASDMKRRNPEQRSDFNSRRSDSTGPREPVGDNGEIGSSHSRHDRTAMRSDSESTVRLFGPMSGQNPSSGSTPN